MALVVPTLPVIDRQALVPQFKQVAMLWLISKRRSRSRQVLRRRTCCRPLVLESPNPVRRINNRVLLWPA